MQPAKFSAFVETCKPLNYLCLPAQPMLPCQTPQTTVRVSARLAGLLAPLPLERRPARPKTSAGVNAHATAGLEAGATFPRQILVGHVIVVVATQIAPGSGVGNASVQWRDHIHIERHQARAHHSEAAGLHSMGAMAGRARESILDMPIVLGE